MAITPTLLASTGTTADSTSLVTSAMAPGANRLVLFTVFHRTGGATTASPTISGGGFTSWTLVRNIDFNAPRDHIDIFRAISTAPGSGAATVNFPTTVAVSAAYSVVEWAGVIGTGTNGENAIVQTVGDTDVASTVNSVVALAGFTDTANVSFAAFMAHMGGVAGGWTTGSDYTALHAYAPTTDLQGIAVLSEWRATTNTSANAVSTISGSKGAIALELAAAAAGQFDLSATATILFAQTAVLSVQQQRALTASATVNFGMTGVLSGNFGIFMRASMSISFSMSAGVSVQVSLAALIAIAFAFTTSALSVRTQQTSRGRGKTTSTLSVFNRGKDLLINKRHSQTNTTSPQVSFLTEVTTSVTELPVLSFGNARTLVIIPPSTNPHPMRFTADTAEVGVALSCRDFSVFNVPEMSDQNYHLYTTSTASIPGVRVMAL